MLPQQQRQPWWKVNEGGWSATRNVMQVNKSSIPLYCIFTPAAHSHPRNHISMGSEGREFCSASAARDATWARGRVQQLLYVAQVDPRQFHACNVTPTNNASILYTAASQALPFGVVPSWQGDDHQLEVQSSNFKLQTNVIRAAIPGVAWYHDGGNTVVCTPTNHGTSCEARG